MGTKGQKLACNVPGNLSKPLMKEVAGDSAGWAPAWGREASVEKAHTHVPEISLLVPSPLVGFHPPTLLQGIQWFMQGQHLGGKFWQKEETLANHFVHWL